MDKWKYIDIHDRNDYENEKLITGDEVCGSFLSSPDFLNRIFELAKKNNETAIITPYLTPDTEIHFKEFLVKLPGPARIIINDFGALQFIKNSGHIPVIGRLLMRQNTDPVIMKLDIPQPLKAHFCDTPVFTNEASQLLMSGYDKMTVMMDFLPHGMPAKAPAGYDVLLNLRNVLVTVFPCNFNCCDCPGEEFLQGRTRAGVPVYQKRKLFYYKQNEIVNSAIPDYVTGLIV